MASKKYKNLAPIRDKALFKTAKELLLQASAKAGALNSLGFVHSDGTTTSQFGAACYAPLPRNHKGPNNPMVYFVDCPLLYYRRENGVAGLKKEEVLGYVDWIINKSVWSLAFETKDPEEMLRHGSVFNTDYPAQFVVQAACSLRYLGEYPAIVYNWAKFSPHCDGHIALMLAHGFRKVDNRSFSFSHWTGGHTMYGSKALTWDGVQRQINHDFSLMSELVPMSESSRYAGMTGIWSKNAKNDQWGMPRDYKGHVEDRNHLSDNHAVDVNQGFTSSLGVRVEQKGNLYDRAEEIIPKVVHNWSKG